MVVGGCRSESDQKIWPFFFKKVPWGGIKSLNKPVKCIGGANYAQYQKLGTIIAPDGDFRMAKWAFDGCIMIIEKCPKSCTPTVSVIIMLDLHSKLWAHGVPEEYFLLEKLIYIYRIEKEHFLGYGYPVSIKQEICTIYVRVATNSEYGLNTEYWIYSFLKI